MLFSYHWALIVGPKTENLNSRGKRFHVKNADFNLAPLQWKFEEVGIPLIATAMLIVRVLVGKVENMERLQDTLRLVPVLQNDPAWNCVVWVQSALEALQIDAKAMGASQLEWKTIRNEAMSYCNKKIRQGRFDGSQKFDMSWPPTYDILEGQEKIV